MRCLLVHNSYGGFSGEEAVVDRLSGLLREDGHEVSGFFRSSAEIPGMIAGPARAFASGIHSFSSAREMRRRLRSETPDVVHVHNVFPLISPSVLPVCRKAGVPVVMTLHNYRLVCPTGLHLRNGEPCDKCSRGREYWCAVHNCEGARLKSLGYASRNWFARVRRSFLDNVTLFSCLTEFQRARLIAEGYPEDRLVVVPNASDEVAPRPADRDGAYAGFIGRISPEKGVATLIEAARLLPEIPFRAAGSLDRMPRVADAAPGNLRFLGQVRDTADFYGNARMIVLCSDAYEGFPLTLVEAMLHGRPVICSRVGGLAEIVDEGSTGLLVERGDPAQLAGKIRSLWTQPDLARRLGKAGRDKAEREYTPRRLLERTLALYEKAILIQRGMAHR